MPSAEILPDGTIKITDASDEQLVNIIKGMRNTDNKTQVTKVPATVEKKKSKELAARFHKESKLKRAVIDLADEGQLDQWYMRKDIAKVLRQRGHIVDESLLSTYLGKLVDKNLLESRAAGKGKGNGKEYRKSQENNGHKQTQNSPETSKNESEGQLKLQ